MWDLCKWHSCFSLSEIIHGVPPPRSWSVRLAARGPALTQKAPVTYVTVGTSGMGPKLALDVLEVMPDHPSGHGILGGLILFGYMKVSGPGQRAWQTQGTVDGPMCDSWLLGQGQEGTCHPDQLPHHVQVGIHDVP